MASRKQQAAALRAQSRGFRNVYQMRQFQKQNPKIPAAQPTITRGLYQAKDTVRLNRARTRASLLAQFGVSGAEYNRRDRENRAWAEKELAKRSRMPEVMLRNFLASSAYHNYQTDIADSVVWTEAKVGYVLSFYAANVNRQTNYESLFDDKLKVARGALRNRQTVNGFGKMNSAQYYYLTQYTDLMTVAEYEAKYGSAQLRAQAGASAASAVA